MSTHDRSRGYGSEELPEAIQAVGAPHAPLSVVIVTPKSFVGGAEKWLLSFLDHAPEIRAVVVVLDRNGPLTDELDTRGIRRVSMPTGASGIDIAASAVRLRAILRSEDPDVVLANGIKAASAALGTSRILGIPCAWVRHEDSFAATLGRAATSLADLSVLVAPPGAGMPGYPHVVIPPPVLDEPLAPREARSALSEMGVPEDGLLRVGVLARLVRYKGIDSAIRALPAAPNWRLVVAGIADPGAHNDEFAYLSDLATDLGVAGRVSWIGEVAKAGPLAAGVDAIAVPTRDDVPGYPPGEGFGMTVVEAFAAGKPVLADASVVPAARLEGYRAAVVPIDCHVPATLGEGLRQLEDPAFRGRLEVAARSIGAAHPRPRRTAGEMTRALARVSHRPGAGSVGGPALSVVTTVFNEAAGIDKWLDGIVSQLGPDDELVIVDGGSRDETVQRVDWWSAHDARIRLISEPGAGISAGRNIGVGAAKHEWIACTDAGCTPDPGWLDALRAAAAEGEYDLVTGVYRAGPASGPSWQIALAAVGYPLPEELRRATPLVRLYTRLFGRGYDATLPTGRSVAFTKTAWRAAGGYPENLATAEDVLFGKRAVAAGARPVLCADAAVTWDQRPSLGGNLRMFRGYGRGDGQSGDAQLVLRDLARVGAYSFAPIVWFTAPRTRLLAAVVAGLYVSVPIRRTLRSPRPFGATALVPAMAALRDIAKAVGCVEGLAQRSKH